MICFYHGADFDGKCSAAVVARRYPDCELIPIDYGQPFPWEKIHSDETVIMVDFTLQPYSDMVRLKALCQLVWIDHHKTSLEWAEQENFDCMGLRSIQLAGCELTWNYLFGLELPCPTAVYLLGRYDVWDHHNEMVLPFQYGMRLRAMSPNCREWWEILFTQEKVVSEIVEVGKICLDYAEKGHAGICEMCGFDLTWEGLLWTVVNGPYRGSMVHKSRFDSTKHDAMLGFFWTGKQWLFSLTTDKPGVDVSEIARKYGGGGHKGAAGFQADVLPFTLNKG